MTEYIVTLPLDGQDRIPLTVFDKGSKKLQTAVFASVEEAAQVVADELNEQDDHYRKGLLQPSEMNDVTDYKIEVMQWIGTMKLMTIY